MRRTDRLCVAQFQNGLERRRYRIASSSESADGFAGWSDSDDGDHSSETQKKNWLQVSLALCVV